MKKTAPKKMITPKEAAPPTTDERIRALEDKHEALVGKLHRHGIRLEEMQDEQEQ